MGFRLANIDDRAALVDAGDYYDIATISAGALPSDPMQLLNTSDALSELAASLDRHDPTGSLDEVTLGPPIPRPQKSFGIGLNYLDHANEGSMDLPENPLVFTKFPSCLVGPTSDVVMRSDFCDYEGELVVVIGPGGKDIDAAEAWNHVIGLTIGQDISDRKTQFAAKPPHFDLGKSFDTFGPIGPTLVSLDETNPLQDLRIITKINGEERQNATADQMVFDIPALVSYISHITTLVAGDIIFTGTPAGVGAAQRKYLADGDVIETTIAGLGTLTNRCIRGSDHKRRP